MDTHTNIKRERERERQRGSSLRWRINPTTNLQLEMGSQGSAPKVGPRRSAGQALITATVPGTWELKGYLFLMVLRSETDTCMGLILVGLRYTFLKSTLNVQELKDQLLLVI